MTAQPEALRLADYIDQPLNNPNDVADAVSAELRFLHAENEELRRERDEARRTVRAAHEAGTRLTAQRDALLEALDQCLNGTLIGGHTHNDNGLEVLAQRCGAPHIANELRRLANIARAAIKMVEEEGK